MHKNKEMDDIKKGKEVIIIKVRLVVTFRRRNGAMITMGSIERFLVSGKVLFLLQVVVIGRLTCNNYKETIHQDTHLFCVVFCICVLLQGNTVKKTHNILFTILYVCMYFKDDIQVRKEEEKKSFNS